MLDVMVEMEFPWLRKAVLIICSYPYAMFPINGTHEGLLHTPMLTLVKGAGSLTEYAHVSLIPYLLGIYKRWLLRRLPTPAPREVVPCCLNPKP